jgi:selenocysteine-specific elongation factor
MHVIATAGHVDHGKSTLVRALTGMEPDRLAEERRRGLTIELGYAWTTLPSGEQIAFVDVPGHHRFLSTMLAGVGPVPAAILVVAADGGWEAQTGEHVAALDALGVRHGLVAITRSDLADPAPVRAELASRLHDTSLGSDGDIELIAVSGRTGAGLGELRSALDRLVARLPAPQPSGRIRVWVDRAFTIGGAGTVVTGTLGQGTLSLGDELELAGAERVRPVRVRGLQALGGDEKSVAAVARVAVNLRGVGVAEVARGDALLTPGADLLTRTVDVEVQVPADDQADEQAAIQAGVQAGIADLPSELVFHIGSAAAPARLRPLGHGFARLMLSADVPLRRGDRGLLRDPGRHSVAAAVVVADVEPPALERRGAAQARAFELAKGLDPLAEVSRRGAVSRDRLQLLGVLDSDAPLPDGLFEVSGLVVNAADWREWMGQLRSVVAKAAERDPLAAGLPFAAAAKQAGIPELRLVGPLAEAAGLRLTGGRVTAPGDELPAQLRSALRSISERLRADPFNAPDANDLSAAGMTSQMLAAAERAGELLRLGGPSGPVVLLPDAPDIAVRRLAALAAPFTVSDARQALATTRRVAVPLLEYLDATRRTRRVDANGRVLVSRPA